MSKVQDVSERDLELSLMADITTGENVNTPISSHYKTYSDVRQRSIRWLFNYPGPTTKPLRPTAWLDGLRGIAAAEVVLHHYHLHFLGGMYNYAYGSLEETRQWWRLPLIRNFYHSAHAMVNVFFIISGFVLTQRSLSLIRSKQYDKLYASLSSAVFRRWVRIFAPVAALTFFGMLLVRTRWKESEVGILPIQYHETLVGQIGDWYLATEKFCNPFHLYDNQWDIVHPYEHVMWTLPLEYYGSLVCYATMLGLSRISNTMKRSAVVCGLIYLAMRRANWWTANFLSGILLADYLLSQEASSNPKNGASKVHMIAWSIVALWSFYVCGLPDPEPEKYTLPGYEIYLKYTPESFRSIENGGRFWWLIAGITLTVSISQLSFLRRICETKFCQYLGRISFMMYLVHTYLWQIFGEYLKQWLQGMFVTNDNFQSAGGHVSYVLFWIIAGPVVCIVSGLTTRYVDDPSIRLAKWLENNFIEQD